METTTKPRRLRGDLARVEKELSDLARLTGPVTPMFEPFTVETAARWRDSWVICPAVRALAALRNEPTFCRVCDPRHYPHEAGS